VNTLHHEAGSHLFVIAAALLVTAARVGIISLGLAKDSLKSITNRSKVRDQPGGVSVQKMH